MALSDDVHRGHQGLVVGGVGDGHAQVVVGDVRTVHLGAQPVGVGEMRGAHGAGDAAPEGGAGPDTEGGGTGPDEVRRVHVRAVGRLGHQQRYAHDLGQPLVRGDAELPHRLLVPEVVGLGERPPQPDRVGQVEPRRTVVHQRDVGTDVLAQGQAQFRVTAGVAPRVQLDAPVAQLQALVGHVEELRDAGERRGGGVGGDGVPETAEQAPDRFAVVAAGQVPQGDVDQPQGGEREFVDTVQLPHPVPQPLPLERVGSDQFRAEDPVHQVPQHGVGAGTGEHRHALGSLVGPDVQDRAVAHRSAAAQPVAPVEGRTGCRNVDPVHFDMGDLHPGFRLL